MLSGFNTNIRHRGVLFHVQTEDSGLDNPHVITHLFHGGNIMASEKGDYRDKVESEKVEYEVRALMERQHKDMLRRLTSGRYDQGIEARLGPGCWSGMDRGDSAPTVPPEAAVHVDPPRPAQPEETPKQQLARVFGDGVVTQKPLDEVVLDFLVENARKRKRNARQK
ncbi:MAG: hypothetical protein O7A09_12990 [Proteobacteria bacterium]|nr:hypothetical protein [Pseudomonadota bacterium]MCZ6781873.1 hypothetical protein [Pseudomonadota bacterium]